MAVIQLIICIAMVFGSLFETYTCTLTSNTVRGVACPGQVIRFTCTLQLSEEALVWSIRRAGQTQSIASGGFTSPHLGDEILLTTANNDVNASATISAISPVVSSLTIIATANLDSTIVRCNGPSTILDSPIISVARLPSTPQNVVVSIVKNGTANVTVNIDWGSPVNAGGGVLDSYTVETSPESSTVRVISGTRATLNLTYNVRYVVKVAAENCVGRSSFSMETVKIVGCVLLSNPRVTFEPYTSSAVDSLIFYKCNTGFIPEGRIMSVCGGDGRWDPDPNQYNCTEVNCEAPHYPVNSSVLVGPSNGTRLGSEVTLQCDEGLFPSNEITIICTNKQRWYPDPEGIQCGKRPVTCSEPNNPINGYLREITSSTIQFGCNEGYSPQDTMTAVCIGSDIWSPDPAQLKCTTLPPATKPPVDCGSPQPPANGTLSNITSTLEGSEVTFQCVTTTTAVCKNGRWSPDPGQHFCGFKSDECNNEDAIAVTVAGSSLGCSVVLYICGFLSGLLVYRAVKKSKEKNCKQDLDDPNMAASNERSESPNTVVTPLYEVVDLVPDGDNAGGSFYLRENIAYGPVQKAV